MTRNICLEFITPLFSHGASDTAEIRASSIRGQLHWWFRFLGGTIEDERAVFGGIRQGKAAFRGHNDTMASRIVVRVANVIGTQRDEPTLPHKQHGLAAPRKAYVAGTKCKVLISDRLGGIGAHEEVFSRAVNAWLLMGSLGFRSTRGGGNFIWQDETFAMPEAPMEYQDACRNLLDDCDARGKVAVLETCYDNVDEARQVITDSLGGPSQRAGENELTRLRNPLGKIFQGRKTSPLKYRVLRFADGYRILAFWDGRKNVTGNSDDDFYGVVDLLARRKPRIGSQLKKAFG